MKTFQHKIWSGTFGKKYISRNRDEKEFNERYIKKFGISKETINKFFYKFFRKNYNFLEIGCNVGMQLKILQKKGYKKISGIDIQRRAVKEAKKNLKIKTIYKLSSDKTFFESNSFDVILTNDVLIHLNKKMLKKTVNEIHRIGKKYVWCFEYYSKKRKEIKYRNYSNLLWKDDFKKYFSKKKFKIIN